MLNLCNYIFIICGILLNNSIKNTQNNNINNVTVEKQHYSYLVLEDKPLLKEITHFEKISLLNEFVSAGNIKMIITFNDYLQSKFKKILSESISIKDAFDGVRLCVTKIDLHEIQQETMHFIEFLDKRMILLINTARYHKHKSMLKYKNIWSSALYLLTKINTEMKVIDERLEFNE